MHIRSLLRLAMTRVLRDRSLFLTERTPYKRRISARSCSAELRIDAPAVSRQCLAMNQGRAMPRFGRALVFDEPIAIRGNIWGIGRRLLEKVVVRPVLKRPILLPPAPPPTLSAMRVPALWRFFTPFPTPILSSTAVDGAGCECNTKVRVRGGIRHGRNREGLAVMSGNAPRKQHRNTVPAA